MANYSGTYLAVLVMAGVPLLMNLGFSESCANEIVPIVVGACVLVWRYFKGGVSALGVRK